MFYSFFEYQYDLDKRQLEIITDVTDFFEPAPGDRFFIMDPYLDVLNTLQVPFGEGRLESNMWSFLLSELSNLNSEFRIFTSVNTKGLAGVRADPPFEIITGGQLQGAEVLVCYCPGGVMGGFYTHDRYIILVNETGIKGIHIGPSFNDIRNKDVVLTVFSEQGGHSKH